MPEWPPVERHTVERADAWLTARNAVREVSVTGRNVTPYEETAQTIWETLEGAAVHDFYSHFRRLPSEGELSDFCEYIVENLASSS